MSLFPNRKELVRCPVGCEKALGYRDMATSVVLPCFECEFDHYYKKNERRPYKSVKHCKKKDTDCGCGLCGR